MAKLTVYQKDGKAWRECYKTENELTVYKKLSSDLIAKKLCECTYIKRIKRVQNYNGTIDIIITFSYADAENRADVKAVYTVSDY